MPGTTDFALTNNRLTNNKLFPGKPSPMFAVKPKSGDPLTNKKLVIVLAQASLA
jgi:hypothetical protein